MIELLAWSYPPTFDRSTLFIPDDRPPNLSETIVNTKLIFANDPGPKYDIVLLGDSSGLTGVDPNRLSLGVDQTAYNLCTISLMGAEGHRLYLETMVGTHGAPSALIYHYAPGAINYSKEDLAGWEYLQLVRRWIADAGGLDLENDQPITSDPLRNNRVGKVIKGETGRPLPSQKFREPAGRLLSVASSQERYGNAPRGSWPSHNEVTAILARQRGFLQETHQLKDLNPIEMEVIASAEFRRSLEELVAYCEDHEIYVYLAANPLPERARTKVTLHNLAVQEEAMRQIVSRHENAAILFANQRFYRNDQFATLTHLRPDAADLNSSEIANRILDLRDPPQVSP